MKKLLLFLVMILLPMAANADKSGTCGDNLTWTLVESTGTLTISGTGVMKNYTDASSAPWYKYSYKDIIVAVVIKEGVTSIGSDAFRLCSNLTSVTIPNSVTTIGEKAFIGCSSLSSVTIPNSVTSIGDRAFEYCSDLTGITISNSVISIGASAFSCCYGLTSVTIPNSVTSIGETAFYYCSRLTSVTIPNSVTSIGKSIFRNCSSLASINVASGNKKYDSRENCNAIIEKESNTLIVGCKNTIIPNSVKTIGDRAFDYCSGLTGITIPNSVISIGAYAFSGCSGLTSVTIPNSVTSIGEYAFAYCSSLISVTIPNSVTSIDDIAFSGCDKLTKVTMENPNPLAIKSYTFPNCANAILYVPRGSKAAYKASDNWKKFKAIVEISPIIKFADADVKALCVANWDLDGDGELCESEAEDVTSLGEVFKQKTGIRSFDEFQYFKGVTSVCDYAFTNCRSLTSVTIPKNVTSIGNYVFNSCGNLNTVTIPNTVTSIGDFAFHYCEGLPSVTIPNSVTSIGIFAFFACKSLTSITIPNSVTYLGRSAFEYCESLTSITIPNKLKIIEDLTFGHCGKLKSITIPSSVTSIGNSAFVADSSIVSVVIPSSVTTIGSGNPFWMCKSLTSIIVEPNNIVYDSRNNCNAIIHTGTNELISGCKNTEIPSNVVSLGSYSFSGSCFTSITIPNGVTSIGVGAFQYCFDLEKISIPKSITSIDQSAFYGCKSLTDVFCYNIVVPKTGASAFDRSNIKNATLHVPSSSIGSYKSSDPWTSFKDIVKLPEYSLIYKINEEVYKSYKIEEGETITPEAAPTKEGYTFSGWSEIPETMPAKDVTITGTFSINKYKLIYKIDGAEYKAYEIEYGAIITAEPAPTKDGYAFSGWSEIPATMPAHDVTITGTFKRVYNVGDVTKVVSFIMNGNATSADITNYDMNHDGELNIGDIILVVRWILNNANNSANNVRTRSGMIIDIREYSAAQFEIEIPVNVKLKDIHLVSSMAQSHQMMCRQMDEQTYAVVVYSPTNQLLVPINNNIVEVETEGGKSEKLTIKNAILAKPNGEVANYAGVFASTTGIDQSVSEDESPAVIYDLKGNRLENGNGLKKGLYIINGKKVVVK